jgi:hypothetical protein
MGRQVYHQIQVMFANSFACDHRSKPIKILQGAALEQHIHLPLQKYLNQVSLAAAASFPM